MSRILFVLAALAFLVVAAASVLQGNGSVALGVPDHGGLLRVAVVADRKGEGLPDTPPPSSP
jgi:hypothetical protein